MRQYDYLIIGAGLFGSVMAEQLVRQGKRCLVIDKRSHVGGNIYTSNVNGITVHQYGAHIFHTNDKEVWEYINSFSDFNRYTNSPIANYKGKLYNLPFNMNTFYQMWGVVTPEQASRKIEEQKQEVITAMKKRGIAEPRNLEEQALLLVGKDIYERLIKGYTEKQWGRKCTELPAFIIKRLPVRLVFDNNYFNDLYQGIPIGGYNKLIDGLLQGVECRTDCDFFANRDYWKSFAEKIVFTGQIDEYFSYQFGKLDYRTVRFEEDILETPNYQGNAVVNYTDAEVPYTRIIEHKHFDCFGLDVYRNAKTVISKEFSAEWEEDMEPYYPVNDSRNSELYLQYKALAEQEDGVIFGGRLAEYKYYDMAPTIESVFKKFNKDI